jgi:ABC-type glutathione transport system ATPase component
MDQQPVETVDEFNTRIKASVSDMQTRLNTRLQTLMRESSRRDNLRAVVERNNTDVDDYNRAIELCMACIDQQVDAKTHIEKIATALLNTVMQGVHQDSQAFGQPPVYEFVFDAVEDNGIVTGLKPMIIKDGNKDEPKSYGGGVRNLASFAIRLIYVLLNPTLSQVLILDEPMVNLSPAAWRHVVRFIEDLQKDIGLQIIAITHSGASFPKSYRVSREGDTSIVRELEAV